MYTICRKVFGQYSRIMFRVGIPLVQNFPFQRLSEINHEKMHKYICGLPWCLRIKASACNAGDSGSIPGSGGPPGEGNGNPLQCSCLGNPKDRGAWRATVHGMERVRHNLVTKPLPYVCMQTVFHDRVVTEALLILIISLKILIMSNNNC